MYRHFFKRLFDITVALVALPFFFLIFIFLAPIIKLTDGGPVFYNAPRLGRRGKVFKMYKFRSMRVNSPNLLNADGSTYNGEHDPRVTKIGRFIRKTSLDETPQILNILLGHMSLIGPRAHLTTNYKGYDALDELRKRRLDVRPGLTGYNQAYFRNSVGSEEKLKNDVYYVDNLSFLMDVKVFFKTVASVLGRKNVYVSADAPVATAPTEEAKTEERVSVGAGEK
ncbi:MAG: sugar transferase [Clostridia bacterium]|nr:sugar transferase [Clostridia bacterium]